MTSEPRHRGIPDTDPAGNRFEGLPQPKQLDPYTPERTGEWTKAVRHGQARIIQIALTSAENCATLMVSNDGLAFPMEQPEDKGMGMRMMRRRVETIDGALMVQPPPQRGTEVVCIFAVKPKPQTGEMEHG